jgi:hypothetical protein
MQHTGDPEPPSVLCRYVFSVEGQDPFANVLLEPSPFLAPLADAKKSPALEPPFL